MGSQRSKDDDVARISTSIFVTNFPENFTAKDLFNTCNQYGYVVDSFIPLKRSKVGKRFGFVRFINVFSVNVVKCPDNYGSKVNDSPALILEDDCVLSKDLSNCLFGRVKEFTAKEAPGWVPDFTNDDGDEKGIDTINQEPDYSLKYPPGFTPKADTDGTSVHDEAANDVNIPSSSGGSILDLLDDVVKQNGMDLLIIVVYAPHDTKEKVMLWDYLAREITRWKGKVVVMGDFNEVWFRSNRFGSNFNIHGANIFNSFISTVGLTEVELGGCSFTWCHKSTKKMSKLDRFFVSENFLNTYPHISAILLERFLSDHRPILLREHHLDYGPIPFRFFHYWCEIYGFRKLVADSWLEAPTNEACDMLDFMGKLKFLKSKIRIWNKANLANRNQVKDQLNSELETVENLIDSGFGDDDESSLWSKTIKAIYGVFRNVDGVSNSGHTTCWHNIVKEVNLLVDKGIDLRSYMCFKLGNGEEVRFCLQNFTSSFRRHPRGRVESQQFEELMSMVRDIHLVPMADRWSWTLSSSGDFFVSSSSSSFQEQNDAGGCVLYYVVVRVDVP
nr:RNA-directed DNA polymerase, eukaryota [Tanacetum cinerariifolium]